MKNLFSHKGILFGVIAVLLALGMGISALTGGGRASPSSNLLGTVLTPLQNVVESLRERIDQLYSRTTDYEKYQAENEMLRTRIAEMEEEARESVRANEENARLRALLGLRGKRRDFEFESANVVAFDLSNWASTLTLSKGSLKGIEVGQCVVNEQGKLVGVIFEVGLNWSTVTTVIDTDMEAGATVFRTQMATVAEGDFNLMQKSLLKISYLPRDSDIQIGDMVLTSGAGGKFPSGLVIGSVTEVLTEKDGISEYAVIEPAVELSELVQVFVIKSFDIED